MSRLRGRGFIPQAALRDVYVHRPLSQLAAHWQQQETAEQNTTALPRQDFLSVKPWQFYLCAAAQTISLLFLFCLFSLHIFLPYLAYYYTQQEYDSHGVGIVVALAMFLLLPPSFMLLTIAGKKLIGKFKAGDYPLWGFTYFRYWLHDRLLGLSPIQFFNDTPLFIWYVRCLGMRVGSHSHLGKIDFGMPELITIGRHVTLSSEVVLDNAVIENGWLKLRPITIDDHAHLGSRSVVGGGAHIGRFGELGDLSALPENTHIPPAQIWHGSPARLLRQKTPAEMPSIAPPSRRCKQGFILLYTLLLLVFPLLLLLPVIPTVVILNEIDMGMPDYDFSYLVISPLLSLPYIGLFALITIILTRLLMRGIKPGTYSLYSMIYVRKWVVDQAHQLALFVLHPLFASVYVSSYLRLLGTKIGANTEISTASNVTHHLLSLGSNSFIADAVMLGESDIRNQQLILQPTIIGNGTFVGNSAVVAQGSQIPDNILLGVLSLAPASAEYQAGISTYLGSPALPFPSREASAAFPEELTFKPNWRRRVCRGLVELIRIILPTTVVICCSVLFIAYAHDGMSEDEWWEFLLELPLYYLGLVGLPAFGVVLLLKWLLIGRYQPKNMPMWSLPVWISEAITTTYEALAVPFLLDMLRGTPWLPLFLRLLGCKIGKRTVLNTTDFTEFDCVSVGDDSALNVACGPQTHLFEDRIMKIGRVAIGKRCSIGSCSIVLYDSVLGDGVKLAPLSLVMKGENLPANSHWQGSPVQVL
ncbi:MAG: Pls/PosA family non-ribosomal peptide synthetase [Alphaproteobacteria bacterium]